MKTALVVLLMLLGLAGCGIKGNPVTPRPGLPSIPPAGEEGGLDL